MPLCAAAMRIEQRASTDGETGLSRLVLWIAIRASAPSTLMSITIGAPGLP